MRLWLCLLLSPQLLAYSSARDAVVSRTYWMPRMFGERLTYCDNEHARTVAKKYCQQLGFNHQKRYKLETNKLCFAWIECTGVRKPTIDFTEQLFYRPRWHNYPLAWCYDTHHGCGARAAQAYCRHQSFARVKSYQAKKHLFITQQIGDEHRCYDKDCTGFKYIICQR